MSTPRFPGMTRTKCELAFSHALVALQESHGLELANKVAGTMVVLGTDVPLVSPHDADKVGTPYVREHALYVSTVDPRHESAAKYEEIALTKARDLWLYRSLLGPNFTGLDIQQHYPHLYYSGMTKWHGGICRNGVIYAFSGVQGHYDMAVAETTAVWLEAMCRQAVYEHVMPSESSFIE